MKTLILAGALTLLASSTAMAVPFCTQPIMKNGMVNYGYGLMSEGDAAKQFEVVLRGLGYDGHNTRFWNGCVVTFITNADTGKDEMHFFNPDTLTELPAN